jgi:hypothetical protein
VGFPVTVVVPVVVVLTEVVLVVVGGISQMVPCGSLTHLLLFKLQHKYPEQSLTKHWLTLHNTAQ